LRKRKQPIVVQQSDLRETEKTLLSRTDLQINRNRNEKNTSELVCISKRNFEWEKEPYHTRMSRRSKCNELGCRNHHRNRLLEPKSRAREMATDIGWCKKLVHGKKTSHRKKKKHRKEQASTVILDIEINSADHHSQKAKKTHILSLSLSLSLSRSLALCFSRARARSLFVRGVVVLGREADSRGLF
jgi:hypothetical protein